MRPSDSHRSPGPGWLEDLTSTLAERARRERAAAPAAAAVLVPLIDDGGPLRLLLTRRSETVATHKGQVAFPGGYVEDTDAGPVEAALREAHEVVGLGPEAVEVLGLLDDYPTVTGRTIVTPVVGRIPRLPALTPEPGEVARIFSIPLEDLLRPEGWVRQPHPGGRDWPVFYFDWDGETLWGLSAYITLQLLQMLPVEAPVDVASFGR